MTVHLGGGTRLPADVKREIVRRYTADDEPIRVIAAAVGCSYVAAHLALTSAGTPKRSGAGPRKPAAARATRRTAADPSGRSGPGRKSAPAALMRAAEPETPAGERPLRSHDLDHISAAANGVLLTGDLRNLPGGTPVGWSNQRNIVWSLPIPAGIRAQAALPAPTRRTSPQHVPASGALDRRSPPSTRLSRRPARSACRTSSPPPAPSPRTLWSGSS